MLFNKYRYEVLITNKLSIFESAKNVLNDNKIDYEIKLINNSTQRTHKGRDFYIKTRHESYSIDTMYYIYVTKSNFDLAKYLLNTQIS